MRERLALKQPVTLVATQVIEAGVDVDFPWGARAFAPLWSVAQAAGRVNREGLLQDALGPALGTLVVFLLENGGMPPDVYRTAANLLDRMLPVVPRLQDAEGRDLGPNFGCPAFIKHNYNDLLAQNTDAFNIQAMRRKLDFRGVAKAYRMIRDDQIAFCVDWRPPGTPAGREAGHALLDVFLKDPSRLTGVGSSSI